ncbi:hypothetical protein N2599_09805 [Rhizobium sullae]|uniref:Uncharacterized protein n=1 Tax=Rhizobium sullae TaxID=50338 RepID=A0A2N0D122_RHISU|nr:hypothetical protein [Rhizobium sullae]PKA39815.1 hypothetical protein CWR43_31725 [Rhizobium sullae]UWU16245.1 hypothetical protein N2599_09805 [Rhizobium sullae]
MPAIEQEIRQDARIPSGYSVQELLASPLFATSLTEAASRLIGIYHEAPRAVRYTSDLRRWLVAQAALAFYFENRTGVSREDLTVTRLTEFGPLHEFASRNTIASYMAQMRQYKLFTERESRDKRLRPLVLSEAAEHLIRNWFDSHMASLDLLDGGERLAVSQADPRLLYYAHPPAARALIADPRWNDPPESVKTFTFTNLGSNVIHDLVARFPSGSTLSERCYVGELKPGTLAGHYHVSRTHIVRVLNRAKALGDIGWDGLQYGDNFWISARLIEDYRRWQAVKFEALSRSIHGACVRLYA